MQVRNRLLDAGNELTVKVAPVNLHTVHNAIIQAFWEVLEGYRWHIILLAAPYWYRVGTTVAGKSKIVNAEYSGPDLAKQL